MANTALNSWQNVKNYLNTYIDSNKNWDNENVRDYSVLQQKKLSADQLAEGQTLLSQYLADAQAYDNMKKAQATAENNARQATAEQDYLHTRLGSYLQALQGNSGQAGYQGLTSGQSVALRNSQAQAQQQIGQTKQTALSDMLSTYQQALSDNSKTAIDQMTTIAGEREKKTQDNDTRLQGMMDSYLSNRETEGGKIYKKDYDKMMDYLMTNGASNSLINETEMLYGDKVIADKKEPDIAAASREELNQLKTENEQAANKTTEEKEATANAIAEQEKVAYGSSVKSGAVFNGYTFTLKFNSKDGYFKNDDVTITAGNKLYQIDKANNLSEGQVFLYNGVPYVKGANWYSVKVVDYAGNGAYEKLKKYLQGTYYDFKG